MKFNIIVCPVTIVYFYAVLRCAIEPIGKQMCTSTYRKEHLTIKFIIELKEVGRALCASEI
jgi:hypothetical protein